MARHKLQGTVMDNDSAELYRWFGYQNLCCPADVRDALESDTDDEIVFEINSSGGSVYSGFEMYSLISKSEKRVCAEVQSIAASAMSVVTAACDTVRMSPVANMMIHRSSIRNSGGNSEQLRQDAQMLDTIDESILNAYERKVGDKCSRKKLRGMMEDETFLTAEEAIAIGLADEMIERDGEAGADPADAAASIGRAVMPMVMNALPPIEDLRRIRNDRQDMTENETEEREEMEQINTMEELRAQYPEMTAQIAAEAAQAERERILAIDAVAMNGFETIIEEAKADRAKDAGWAAMAIIAEQKKLGTIRMSEMREDAEDAAVEIEDDETPMEKDNADADAKETVALWRKMKGAEK